MANSGWYAEIEGLQDLITKLTKLEQLNVQDVLDTTAEEGTKILQANTASAGFPKSSQSVDIHESKYTKSGKSVSIGYKGDFDNWKELYYHHHGYQLYYFGHKTNKHITCHVGVFDEIRHLTVQQIQPVLEKRVKQRIHEILR